MKVDPVALTSCGVYSEVYGLGEEGNIANLYASLGYIEDAPTDLTPTIFGGGIMLFGMRPTMT